MDEYQLNKPRSTPETPADDEEYELEPLDESVVSAEDRRGKEVAEDARLSIDIDDVYREADRERGAEIVEQWIRNFRFGFRFQVKHLLIATAVLAIGLTLFKLGLFWKTFIILFMLAVAGLYLFLKWEEQKQQAEAARKREALYARRRAQLRAKQAAPASADQSLSNASSPLATNDDEMLEAETTREPFRIRFSLRQLIIAMTTAAVVLGMIRVFGGPAQTATILGLVAFTGLIVHAIGYEPPQTVILGWWFILVLYVLLSIFAAVWASFA